MKSPPWSRTRGFLQGQREADNPNLSGNLRPDMNRFVDYTFEACLQSPNFVPNMFVWFAGQHLVITTQEGRTLKVIVIASMVDQRSKM